MKIRNLGDRPQTCLADVEYDHFKIGRTPVITFTLHDRVNDSPIVLCISSVGTKYGIGGTSGVTINRK
jgi:hypothetical protein